MKKVYKIYSCIMEDANSSDVTIEGTPDFSTEMEAEAYLKKNMKPAQDYTRFYFILPTYKFLPLDN